MSAFRSIMVWLGLSSPAQAASGDAVYFLPAYADTMRLGAAGRAWAYPENEGAMLAPAYEDTTLLGTGAPSYLEPT